MARRYETRSSIIVGPSVSERPNVKDMPPNFLSSTYDKLIHRDPVHLHEMTHRGKESTHSDEGVSRYQNNSKVRKVVE